MYADNTHYSTITLLSSTSFLSAYDVIEGAICNSRLFYSEERATVCVGVH